MKNNRAMDFKNVEICLLQCKNFVSLICGNCDLVIGLWRNGDYVLHTVYIYISIHIYTYVKNWSMREATEGNSSPVACLIISLCFTGQLHNLPTGLTSRACHTCLVFNLVVCHFNVTLMEDFKPFYLLGGVTVFIITSYHFHYGATHLTKKVSQRKEYADFGLRFSYCHSNPMQ